MSFLQAGEPRTALRSSHISPTFSLYLGRVFLIWFVSFFIGLIGIILLVSMVDLLDRFKGDDAGVLAVFHLAILRAPHFSMEALPFVTLFANIACFWRLTRSHELVVSRSAGISIWQILLPLFVLALLIGSLAVGALNPFAASLLKLAKTTERELGGESLALSAVSKNGIWLRQADSSGQSVIHAEESDQAGIHFKSVIVFQFNEQDSLIRRIDAKEANLTPGYWHLREVLLSSPGSGTREEENFRLETDLTATKIQDSLAPPSTLSFWELPNFIDLLEESGFSAARHKLQFNRLLSTPFLLIAMILIASAFSIRPQRRGRVGLTVLAGVITGFLLYFLSNFVFALGVSGKIPVILAAWTPTVVSLFGGIALLFHLEDG